MQYTERLPLPVPTKSVVAPLVALLVGAAAASGVWALTDSTDSGATAPAKVVVVQQPPPSVGGVELRGSKASTFGSQTALQPNDAAAAARTDPHGTAAILHGSNP